MPRESQLGVPKPWVRYICPGRKGCKSTECPHREKHERERIYPGSTNRDSYCDPVPKYCPACELVKEAKA